MYCAHTINHVDGGPLLCLVANLKVKLASKLTSAYNYMNAMMLSDITAVSSLFLNSKDQKI